MALRARKTQGRFVRFARNHLVFVVAFCAAALSLFCATPLTNPLVFIDTKTIACLFCILAAVAVLDHGGMMDAVARMFGKAFSSVRTAILALVGMTMVLSMFITNDMALVTMLPLSAAALLHGGWLRALPFCFIMQNLAANLGGMILPFGNPQNLFLFAAYHVSFDAFLQVMAPPFVASVALIALCCVVIAPRYEQKGPKPEPAPASASSPLTASAPSLSPSNNPSSQSGSSREETRSQSSHTPLDHKLIMVGLAMFAATIASVFRLVPYEVVLVAVVCALLLFDRCVLKTFDWTLLGTFACFFIFAGNVSTMPIVREMFGSAMQTAPVFTSAALSQIISNVPAAVLLAQVTDAWQALLVGVNIGGAGTVVASLASLITIDRYQTLKLIGGRAYSNVLPTTRVFMAKLMAYGFVFLAILIAISVLYL